MSRQPQSISLRLVLAIGGEVSGADPRSDHGPHFIEAMKHLRREVTALAVTKTPFVEVKLLQRMIGANVLVVTLQIRKEVKCLALASRVK